MRSDDGELYWMIRLEARMGRTASEKDRPRRANAADADRLAEPASAGGASESGRGGAASSGETAPEASAGAHTELRPADKALSSPGTLVIEAAARAIQEDEDMDSSEFEHLQEYEPEFESEAEVKPPEGKRARLKAVTEVMNPQKTNLLDLQLVPPCHVQAPFRISTDALRRRGIERQNVALCQAGMGKLFFCHGLSCLYSRL